MTELTEAERDVAGMGDLWMLVWLEAAYQLECAIFGPRTREAWMTRHLHTHVQALR